MKSKFCILSLILFAVGMSSAQTVGNVPSEIVKASQSRSYRLAGRLGDCARCLV
jgi:hypothetical protein